MTRPFFLFKHPSLVHPTLCAIITVEMLEKIVIRHYRCFDIAEIDFSEQSTIAFVGVNNSGKSTLLKFFYECRHLFALLGSATGNLVRAALGRIQETRLFEDQERFDFSTPSAIFSTLSHQPISIDLHLGCPAPYTWLTEEHPAPLPARRCLYPKVVRLTIAYPHHPHDLLKWSLTILKLSHGRYDPALVEAPRLYEERYLLYQEDSVVDLSSLQRTCFHLSNTLYIGAFRNILNVATPKTRYYDLEVGAGLIKAWQDLWNSGPENQKILKNVTNAIAETFRLQNLAIEVDPSQDNLIVNLNGLRYRLSEEGAGLSQFIVILTNVAVSQASYILIDEPELNLHPTLQRKLINELELYAAKGVLFCSHSIGLARAEAHVVYWVSQNTNGVSALRKLPKKANLAVFLGELGYGDGYTELSRSKILLVEGPTEIKVMRELLRKFHLDDEFILVHLGGGSGINGKYREQFEEIINLHGDIQLFSMIDSEKSSARAKLEQPRIDFLNVCRQFKVTCHILELRAMENYFTQKAIDKTFPNRRYHALKPYDRLKDLPATRRWSKDQNWKIARNLSMAELMQTDLGQFLASLEEKQDKSIKSPNNQRKNNQNNR